jgi:hypothetical protein
MKSKKIILIKIIGKNFTNFFFNCEKIPKFKVKIQFLNFFILKKRNLKN